MMYSPGRPYIVVAPVVTSWAVAGQRMVFFHIFLQARVTLEAFPIVSPRGRSSKFPWRGTYLLFTGMLLNVNITVHVDIQFPTKKCSVKTVDCMFCMQIPVKLKHKSLCSFCNVNNSQYFETWCTLIDCMHLVKWKQVLFFDRIISFWVRFPLFW